MANTRCGHTSMNHYFGLKPYTGSYDIKLWYNSTSHRVMVLRNPMDRLLSAQRLNTVRRPSHLSEHEWLDRHSGPYLYSLAWRWYSWSYIPFECLSEYIPLSGDTTVTHSVASVDQPVPEHMIEEMAAYETIKQIMPVLTPKQWRELTG